MSAVGIAWSEASEDAKNVSGLGPLLLLVVVKEEVETGEGAGADAETGAGTGMGFSDEWVPEVQPGRLRKALKSETFL